MSESENHGPRMALEVDRLVKTLEREVITGSEFRNTMLEVNLSAGKKLTILGALAGHSSERVRKAVVEVEAFVRNQALSRDFEYVLQNSPLRPGVCLEMFADNVYSPDECLCG